MIEQKRRKELHSNLDLVLNKINGGEKGIILLASGKEQEEGQIGSIKQTNLFSDIIFDESSKDVSIILGRTLFSLEPKLRNILSNAFLNAISNSYILDNQRYIFSLSDKELLKAKKIINKKDSEFQVSGR